MMWGFEPEQGAMVEFQTRRRAELARYRAGDMRVDPPATPAPVPLRAREQRTLREVWGWPAAPKPPFAGQDTE